MNRNLLLLTPFFATLCSFGQTLPAQPTNPATATQVETGKVTRFIAGPDGKPRGFLLQSGTVVMLPPGLGRQLPASMTGNPSIDVTGRAFTYNKDRTIEAQSMTIAGVRYVDTPPPPPPAGPPVPPHGVARGVTPPPPPQPPCDAPSPSTPPESPRNQ